MITSDRGLHTLMRVHAAGRTFLSLALSLSRHARSASMSSTTGNPANRFQQLLDCVDVGSSPRIELLSVDGTTAGLAVQDSLAVLDSSFNPPTRAHLYMLQCAARQLDLKKSLLRKLLGTSRSPTKPVRWMPANCKGSGPLTSAAVCSRARAVLGKQNADKAIVGASLTQRLEMMEMIAATAESPGSILCGVTAHPLFIDKATALQALCGRDTRVVVLVGFDTWVRIIDPKYYGGPEGLDAALRTIFAAVEVAVACREPSSVSNLAAEMSLEAQEHAVRALPDGVTKGRLHVISFDESQMAGVSSSGLRKAVAEGDGPTVRALLPECLLAYVEEQGLYL